MAGGAPFQAAILQVNASTDMQANIDQACALTRAARDVGADLVLMPENVAMMEWGRANITGKARTEAEHPALAAFQDLARETGLWLHCGTLAITLEGEDRIANRTYVLDPKGEIQARYDKIHMFDVDLGGGERYRESATFRPGEQAVTADLPWGTLGLSVCYDLRFPHLFRDLGKAGADFLTIPAAFTQKTGMAHWHVLLRARAIETGCWVFAPAQTGSHANDRKTYGHALIIDPWGAVVADAGEEPGFQIAQIDPAACAEARGMVPALTHDRPYGFADKTAVG
ncbi:MAG: carbon-nitrogen hydrolase family protein [Rhodospirillaceae bacterium]